MGFFDKLKDAGKGALKGALLMAATSYGTVISGKHALCKICMNSSYDKLTFIKVAVVDAEYSIKEDIKTFYPDLATEDDLNGFHTINIVFNNDEKSTVRIAVDKNQGTALPSAEQRIAAQYKSAADFVCGLAKHTPEISDETKVWVNKIMRFAARKEMF